MALSVMEDGGLLSCLVSLDVLTKPSWDCCLQNQWLLAPLCKFTTWPQGRDWGCFVAEGKDSTFDVVCLRVWEGEGLAVWKHRRWQEWGGIHTPSSSHQAGD